MSSIAVLLSLPIFVASGFEELKVRPGEDAILQFQGPGRHLIILLEWSRPELKPDGYVFFFRNNRSYEKYQHDFFKGRVELRDPSMKHGDVSVILRNAVINDTGTYECEITTRNKEELKHSVNLTVTASDEDTKNEKHKDGRDKDGRDKDGRDKDGRDKDGRDKDGRDRDKTLSVIFGVLGLFVLILTIACVIIRRKPKLFLNRNYV